MGCNKCKKQFPGGIGEKDYSGFDRTSWEPRTKEDHHQQIEHINQCKTKGEKEGLESHYGTRFSVLTLLPYFDPIRMTPIDVLHNLFLGTTKRMLSIWKELGFLNKHTLAKVQDRTDSAICPNDVGKLPTKLSDFNFDGFTGDELKNFTILFSMYALHDILPKPHLQCWQSFVLACKYICNHTLTMTDVAVLDGLLLKFCRQFEILYGQERVTPNMHMHAHLMESIRDFGPAYNFWLFSFERYNGILGSISNNKKMIELQLVRRFTRDNHVLNISFPETNSEAFNPIFQQIRARSTDRGSLQEGYVHITLNTLRLSSPKTNYQGLKWYKLDMINFSSSMKIYCLNETEHRCITAMYRSIYPAFDIQVSFSCWKSADVTFLQDTYGSKFSRSNRSSYVMAHWCADDGNIQSFDSMYLKPRPGQVLYYMKHSITVNNLQFEHILACVQWFLKFPDPFRTQFGDPVEVYHQHNFVVNGAAMFIPVQRLKCKFVAIPTRITNRDVIVVLPRNRSMNL